MRCPVEVEEILLEITAAGILRARTAAWAGDAARAALEADHVHNLPALLRCFSPQGLAYYWDVERPGFISQMGSANVGVAEFERLWKRLLPHVPSAVEPIVTT